MNDDRSEIQPPPPPVGHAMPVPYIADSPPESSVHAASPLPIVALVLAVLALVTSFLGPLAFVSWFFGLPAFVVSLIALVKSKSKRGISITALVLSIVAPIISVIVLIVSLAAATDDALGDVVQDQVGIAATETPSGESPAPSSAEPTSEDPVVADRTDLEVTETSFYRTDDYWYYFVTIVNSNANYAWLDAEFTVEAYDAAGVLLDSDFDYTTLLPGDTLALSGVFLGVGSQQIDHLEVRGETDGTNVEGEVFGSLEISAPEVVYDDWSSTVSGTVTSAYVDDQEYVEMIAVVRDSSGVVIAVSEGYVDRVPGGGSARYEVSFWDLVIDASMTVEVYATL